MTIVAASLMLSRSLEAGPEAIVCGGAFLEPTRPRCCVKRTGAWHGPLTLAWLESAG